MTTPRLTELAGTNLQYFGDSLPSSYSAFLDYVVAAPADWDKTVTRVSVSWHRRLLDFVSAVTIDQNISPLTMQLLDANDPNGIYPSAAEYAAATQSAREEMERAAARELIRNITLDAAAQGLNLGDVRGRTFEEVLAMYQSALAEWRKRLLTTTPNMSGMLPEDVAAIEVDWNRLAFTLGAPPELTLDVLAWADDHILGGHRRFDTAEALAARVRDYLLNRADAFGMELGDFSQPGTSLQSLTMLFEQEYERRLSVYTAALQTYYAAGGRDRTADYLQQGFVPVNSPWYPVDTAQRQLDEFQYFGGSGISGLADALNNNYTRSPDYTLLLLVASILFEPVDWVVTGVEVLGNLAEGDLGAAGVNFGLAIAPLFGGWMDNLGDLRYAADDPPGGAVTGGGLGNDGVRAVLNLVPGSPEHMAQRWREYQSNPDNAGWSYERWRTNYELNQTRALDAQREVEAYAQTLGWGSTSQISLNLPELGGRRLDIIDIDLRRGIEYKSGNYFYRDPDIMAELAKDKALIDSGWTIEWVFQVSDSVSQPLIDELIDAGITVRINGEIVGHSQGLE